jgi:hypothetical protein
MKSIDRSYEIEQLLDPKRVLIIYGARRVGKTTLIEDFLKRTTLKFKLESGDNIRTQQILGSQDFDLLKEYASGYDLIVIDEAQEIPNIGMGLKILLDQLPDLKLLATGSSSFKLSQEVGEPLTGRQRPMKLFPLSQSELLNKYNRFELKERLKEFLVFGSYPEVALAKNKSDKIFILNELVNSYLLRDVLKLENIKAPHQLLQLLKLIAFQAGSEVSINELATKVQLDAKTIARYLDLLEKGFVIQRLGGFSRNLRSEVTAKAKYLFLDNGVRNGIISQFNSLEDRNDIGALFENFVIMERIKSNHYKKRHGDIYFWRTHSGQEIDLIEDRDGALSAYEFKWSEKRKTKTPPLWAKNYQDATFEIINQSNYLDFVL